MNTVSKIKKLAAAAGIAGAAGVAAFGLDTGTAAAAPGQHSASDKPSTSSGSSRHTNKLGTTSGSSRQTGLGVGSDESGGGGTAVPRTWYPEMPHQGG